MSKLISFIIPSRYPDNVRGFFDNIQETTRHPENVEVLVKFDDDQQEIITWLDSEKKVRPFQINYLLTPRLEGVYSGAIAVEQLFQMADPDSYFIQILSDEPRYLTRHWDTVLAQYKHFFKDDIFRLRLSTMKYKNYSSHYECTFQPDSFPIYTRRWLELTEGTGDCWGSDAYQQCVTFHLALGPKSYLNYYREQTYWRDVVVNDIAMGGLEFGVGVSPKVQLERDRRNLKEWNRLTSHVMQEHFSYLSRRLYCAILAAHYHIQEFQLIKRPHRKTVALLDRHGTELAEVSYAVPRLFVYMQNITRRIYTMPRLLFSRLRKRLHLWLMESKNPAAAVTAADQQHTIALNRDQLLAAHQAKRKKIRRALRSIASPYYTATNYIDQRFLAGSRPGISMISAKKPDLSFGVATPSAAQIQWLQDELQNQRKQHEALRNKAFRTSLN